MKRPPTMLESGSATMAMPVAFAEDINPLLAEAFMDEAPGHAARFSEAVASLTGDAAAVEHVIQAQRVAHTLKGSANITGVAAIAELTHHAEDVLDWLAENAALPTADLRETLIETADCVADMVDALREGRPAPTGSGRLMERLRSWRASRNDGDAGDGDPGVDSLAATMPEVVIERTMAEVRPMSEARDQAPDVTPADEVGPDRGSEIRSGEAQTGTSDEPAVEMNGAGDSPAPSPGAGDPTVTVVPQAPSSSAPDVPSSAASEAPPPAAAANGTAPTPSSRSSTPSLRVSVDLVDRLLRLAGEFAVSNVQAQGAHQRMTAQANTLREQYHLVGQRLTDLQDLVEVRGVPSGQRRGAGSGSGTEVDGFDPLELDEYNELHSKTTALAEAMTDFCEVALGLRPELGQLDDTIADQQRISKELSDFVMSARMVPVGSIEERLHRAVRETCRATGKKASLSVTGTGIPVDGDVLNALGDPLLHLLRNAVDHGIEDSIVRREAGKPEVGRLTLAFSREGDNVLVEVGDDGRGFDVARIRELAEARGLIDAQASRTDREVMQLAVTSGFSTREEATQISGRGIGMDVVHKAATDLKGSLDIASRAGKGATISLRVPVTLISMHVLLVRVGQQVFGVPSSTLQQVLFSDAGELSEETGSTVFTIDEQEYRVHDLSRLTGRRAEPGTQLSAQPMLLLRADSGLAAVRVDAAVDGRYLVVKNLGERVPRPAGVIGASILGDGSVAPVLDLRELLRHRGAWQAELGPQSEAPELPDEAPAPEILVVDDSLTARRMLSIALDDAGYRVRTAIDGLDAVEAIEDRMPDLLITDLEMPRMNGLELAGHLGADERCATLPVLMVTSRSTEKHRGQARAAGIDAFITKPYSNEELLDQVESMLASVTA